MTIIASLLTWISNGVISEHDTLNLTHEEVSCSSVSFLALGTGVYMRAHVRWWENSFMTHLSGLWDTLAVTGPSSAAEHEILTQYVTEFEVLSTSTNLIAVFWTPGMYLSVSTRIERCLCRLHGHVWILHDYALCEE